jgi:hypothetical protein
MEKKEQKTASRLQFSSAEINRLAKHAARFTELGFTRFKVVRRCKDVELELEMIAPQLLSESNEIVRDSGWEDV